MTSVLQDWVMELPLREQGVLLTVVRNCDVAPKHPDNLETPERALTAWLRWCFLNPADPREVDYESGSWFRSTPPAKFKQSMFGHLPQHWVGHAMHALEVVAYRHPEDTVRDIAYQLYRVLVDGMHLRPESWEAMAKRLSEDRILAGTVVS
jgi:hypothetical protein